MNAPFHYLPLRNEQVFDQLERIDSHVDDLDDITLSAEAKLSRIEDHLKQMEADLVLTDLAIQQINRTVTALKLRQQACI